MRGREPTPEERAAARATMRRDWEAGLLERVQRRVNLTVQSRARAASLSLPLAEDDVRWLQRVLRGEVN